MTRHEFALPSRALIVGAVLITAGLTPCGCASSRSGSGPLRLGAAWTGYVDDENWDLQERAAAVHHSSPASEPSAEPPDQPANDRAVESAAPRASKPWHVDLAMRGSYTKLAATKRQLDRRLDVPLLTDVFHVFDEPYTPLDRKSDLGFASWYIGAGRQESEYLIWTWYVGGGSGQDLDHQRFLNSTLKVDFRYAYYYTGLTAELYPWRVPHPTSRMTWPQRFCASRPFLLAGFETGYVSAEGEGDYKFSGIPVYHDEQKIRDWLAAFQFGVGWSFPLTERWSINLMGDYTFHVYRPDEYNGWNWVTAIRYRF